MEKAYFNIINKIFKPYQVNIYQLYQKLQSFEKIYNYLKQNNKLPDFDLEKEYEKLKSLNIEIITLNDNEYPDSLKNIDTPPLGFYTLGNLNILKEEILFIAIVGTRKASNYGKNISFKFAKDLSNLGIIIVSGLAYGIDEFAHKGTIDINGKTIAVLGEGIDLVLNSPKRKLIEKILENDGLIISEYSLSTPAMPYHFPLRNRIIAGLSNAILIIEAPIDSGALITANYGLKYGKEIFVVPGEITNKNFEGSHNLIKQGAKLITSVEDILVEFGIDYREKNKIKNLKLSPKEEIIVEILKIKEKTIEDLSKETNFSIQDLLVLLTHMEIKGIIKNKEGKFYLNL